VVLKGVNELYENEPVKPAAPVVDTRVASAPL
jgi:hypothetical protein